MQAAVLRQILTLFQKLSMSLHQKQIDGLLYHKNMLDLFFIGVLFLRYHGSV